MAIDNKQVVRRLIEDVWSKGKLELIDELLDPVYEGSDPMAGPMGRATSREVLQGYRTAFPDLKFEINTIIADGNYVATQWTASGTHRGPLMNLQPTGKIAVVSGLSFAELRNGKIIKDNIVFDVVGLMRQLGAGSTVAPVMEGPQPKPGVTTPRT